MFPHQQPFQTHCTLVSTFFFSLYLKIYVEKTSEKVTKDPKRIEAARKAREKYMNKLKESILNDAKKGSRDTTNTSNETISHTTNASNGTTSRTTDAITIRSNKAYIYSFGTLAVFAIGVCMFFAYKTSQAANKKQVNEKQDQPPKRRHML